MLYAISMTLANHDTRPDVGVDMTFSKTSLHDPLLNDGSYGRVHAIATRLGL